MNIGFFNWIIWLSERLCVCVCVYMIHIAKPICITITQLSHIEYLIVRPCVYHMRKNYFIQNQRNNTNIEPHFIDIHWNGQSRTPEKKSTLLNAFSIIIRHHLRSMVNNNIQLKMEFHLFSPSFPLSYGWKIQWSIDSTIHTHNKNLLRILTKTNGWMGRGGRIMVNAPRIVGLLLCIFSIRHNHHKTFNATANRPRTCYVEQRKTDGLKFGRNNNNNKHIGAFNHR